MTLFFFFFIRHKTSYGIRKDFNVSESVHYYHLAKSYDSILLLLGVDEFLVPVDNWSRFGKFPQYWLWKQTINNGHLNKIGYRDYVYIHTHNEYSFADQYHIFSEENSHNIYIQKHEYNFLRNCFQILRMSSVGRCWPVSVFQKQTNCSFGLSFVRCDQQ